MKWAPFDRERRFMEALNMALIQRALWPLLAAFILLSFSDTLTTVIASVASSGFVELNPFAAQLFSIGAAGFAVAYAFKFIPILPLFYMVAFKRPREGDDFQARLLKFTALVILAAADIYFGAIVLGNNVPQLLRLALR